MNFMSRKLENDAVSDNYATIKYRVVVFFFMKHGVYAVKTPYTLQHSHNNIDVGVDRRPCSDSRHVTAPYVDVVLLLLLMTERNPRNPFQPCDLDLLDPVS